MQERKLKEIPNKNPAGNLNTVLLFSRRKGKAFQNANIGTAFLNHPRIPHSTWHITLHNQYLNEWVDTFET